MSGLLLTGALIGGAYLLKRGLDYQALQKNMAVNIYKPRIHSVTGSRIVFATGVKISNPTGIKASITKPSITLFSNGLELGRSPVENKTVNINGLAETDLGTITITLEWLPLIRMIGTGIDIPKVLEAWKTKSTAKQASAIKIPIEMTVSTYVDKTLFIKTPPVKIC